MAKDYLAMAQDLTLQELKKLLAVKQQLEKLERRRADLQKELAKIEKEIARLSGEKKAARKKVTRKKTARKKVARKKVVRKKAAGKKTTAKKTAAPAKKTTRKAVKKATRRPAKATSKKTPRPRLEDVIADLLSRHGGTMSVKDILAAFKDGKLFPTRSKNFENVLRRTLSTSKRIVRAGRGIYKLK